MNCTEFTSLVHDLARPGAVDKSAEVLARFHAQNCTRCAARLAEAEALARALDAAAEDSAQGEAPAHLEERLVAAFRKHYHSVTSADRSERKPRVNWHLGQREWLGLAAAAAVLLAIGAWNFLQPRAANAPGTKATETPSVVSRISGDGSSEANGTGASASQSDEGAGDELDADSGFVPVPYSEGFSLGDSGLIVRVEMTRSTLADLGYAVDATRGADLVQADLLVGEDGWPRAVRVVH